MNAVRVMLRRWGEALLGSLPRDGASWAAVVVLGLGMMVLGVALIAERGIVRGAVAPEHAGLRIVGRASIGQGEADREPAPMSLGDYAAWRDAPGLNGLSLAERAEAIVAVEASVLRVSMWRVTAELPGMLGLDPPDAGRLPRAVNERGLVEVALSSAFATRWFGDPEAALEQRLMLDGMPGLVVGVLREPAGDAFAGIDAWAVFDPEPLLAMGFDAEPDDPLFTTPYLIGIVERTDEAPIEEAARGEAGDPVVAPLSAVVLGPRIPLALRLSVVAAGLLYFVSLISAAMLLAGALLARREELALRLAMGSTRHGLLLGLMAEAVVVSLLASGGALLGVWWLSDAAREGLLGTLPGARGMVVQSLGPSEWIVGTLLGALVLGLAAAAVAWPARSAWCVRGLPGVGRSRWSRLDDAAVATHAALATAALALVVAVGGLASRAMAAPEGLDVRRVGAMTITLPWWRITDDNERWRIVRDTLEAVARLEGFEAIAAADNAPLVGPDFRAIVVGVSPENSMEPASLPSAIARLRAATPGATALLGIEERRRLTEQAATTLLRLYEADFPPLPATISRALAVALFGDEDRALGQPIELGEGRIPALVLAVVNDAADGPGAFDAGGPSIWLPMPIGWESASWSLLVRLPTGATEAQRARADDLLHAAVRSVVDDAAIDPVVWLDRRVVERARIYVVSAAISGSAALVALLLALLACVARTRLAVAGRLDELRLRAAFGQRALLLAGSVALPGCIGAGVGVSMAIIVWPALGLGVALGDAEAMATIGVWPGVVVLAACLGACFLTARLARIDAGALLHAL